MNLLNKQKIFDTSAVKGRIMDIKKFAVHDGDGIRTTVFLKGCPLRCKWCHNPEGLSAMPELSYFAHKCNNCGDCVAVCPKGAFSMIDGKHYFDRLKCDGCGLCESVCYADALKFYGWEMTAPQLMPLLLEDRHFYDNTGGGVTLSGGEPMQQAEFCGELLRKLKEKGIHTAVDTSGFASRAAIDGVLPYTDLFLYDIKAFDEDVHIMCTGQSNKSILDNLKYIDRAGKKTEIRIPYVPMMNSDEMEKIRNFLCGLDNIVKIKVLPYHNYAGYKYQSLGIENTMPEIPLPDKYTIACVSKLVSSCP